MDVQVDDVRVDVRLRAPDGVEDLLPGEDLAGMADEVAEQGELAGRQVDRPVADLGDVPELVELEVAGREPRRPRRRPAAGRGRGSGRSARRTRTAWAGSRRRRRRARRPARRPSRARSASGPASSTPFARRSRRTRHAVDVGQHPVEDDDVVGRSSARASGGHARPARRRRRGARRSGRAG